ncbi:hypothetical protein BGW41_000242 [Actinomortierella wolfii]|nr:hypothetical protein BGW41_000242 [Actinomortierella wolfii]
MGQLVVQCFDTQETTSTIYGFAYGYNNDKSGSSSDKEVVILLKSNAAPANPDALTWSVVSTIRRDNVKYIDSDFHCLVDPRGSFTVFGYSARQQRDSSSSRPGGFRYDPDLSPSSNSTGPGGWTNIGVPSTYPWTTSSPPSALFYLTDASGKHSIHHAFSLRPNTGVFSFGSLNTATNTMDMTSATWTLGREYHLFLWNGTRNETISLATPIAKDMLRITGPATVGNSDSAFMLIQSGTLFHELPSDYVVKALYVRGPSAGTVQDVISNIAVSENLAFYEDFSKGSSSGSGPMNPGLIVAIVVPVLLIFGFILNYVRMKRYKAKAALQNGLSKSQEGAFVEPVNHLDDTKGLHYPPLPPASTQAENDVDPSMPSEVKGGPGSNILPGPVSYTISEAVDPNQALYLQSPPNPPVFSSHPRPNCATTIDHSTTTLPVSSEADPILGQDTSVVPWLLSPLPLEPASAAHRYEGEDDEDRYNSLQ